MWSRSFGTFESLKDNYVIYYPAGEATAGAAVEGEQASKHHLCSILYILPIAYLLPITYWARMKTSLVFSSLYIAYCLWPIAYYQLPIAYYLLATYCLLSQQQNISIWQTTCVQFFKMKPSAKIFLNLFFFLQVRYFTPPQADQPEIFIMAEQEGYGGNYGGDGTKPGRHVFSFR